MWRSEIGVTATATSPNRRRWRTFFLIYPSTTEAVIPSYSRLIVGCNSIAPIKESRATFQCTKYLAGAVGNGNPISTDVGLSVGRDIFIENIHPPKDGNRRYFDDWNMAEANPGTRWRDGNPDPKPMDLVPTQTLYTLHTSWKTNNGDRFLSMVASTNDKPSELPNIH